MPLHDWADLPDWESVHQLWIVELFRGVKARLPVGYRASLGTVPALTVGATSVHPDVSVRHFPETVVSGTPDTTGDDDSASWQPDTELAVLTLDPNVVVQVTLQGKLVAAVELISPRNKDRAEARLAAQNRYLGYLTHGVHLLLIDVHPLPRGYSFADALAQAMALPLASCPSPMAVSYRVRDAADGPGRLLGLWPRPMKVGEPLPTLPLAITPEIAVTLNLEQTYQVATKDAYLS